MEDWYAKIAKVSSLLGLILALFGFISFKFFMNFTPGAYPFTEHIKFLHSISLYVFLISICSSMIFFINAIIFFSLNSDFTVEGYEINKFLKINKLSKNNPSYSLVQISHDRILVVFRKKDRYGINWNKACVLSISGNKVIPGALYNF